MPRQNPAVLVVTSLVTRGSVGGRGAVFALERLGFPVWFVPTILLPWHPGQGRGTRIVMAPQEFAGFVDDLIGSPKLGEVGAVLTGYFGSPEAVEATARLVAAVKARNPKAIYLCDPVMGDLRADGSGGLYIAEATADAIRASLLGQADIITPNRFELGWLSGMPVTTTADAIAAARSLKPATTLVTSAPAMMGKAVATLLVEAQSAVQAEHPLVQGAPNGTGDLFAALYLAAVLSGVPSAKALERSAGSVFDMVARSVRSGSDELTLAAEQAVLDQSLAQVTMRTIGEARKPGPRAGRG
jgi:pyridoxine kinase